MIYYVCAFACVHLHACVYRCLCTIVCVKVPQCIMCVYACMCMHMCAVLTRMHVCVQVLVYNSMPKGVRRQLLAIVTLPRQGSWGQLRSAGLYSKWFYRGSRLTAPRCVFYESVFWVVLEEEQQDTWVRQPSLNPYSMESLGGLRFQF